LGDLGRACVARLVAVAVGAEVDLEHLDVAGVERDDRVIADHVHVAAHHLGEQVRLHPAQVEPAGRGAFLGRTDLAADGAEG